jgi:hypothetical protein
MPLVRAMFALVRVIMSVRELLLVATLPALAADTLVRRVLPLAALGAAVGTAAGCIRRAFATGATATATTATSAATTATRLAIALAHGSSGLTTLPVGTAIWALRVLTFSARGERRARIHAISDVVRDPITCAIYIAATVRVGRTTGVAGTIALSVVAAVGLAICVTPIPIATVAPALSTIALRVVLTTTLTAALTTCPTVSVPVPATTAVVSTLTIVTTLTAVSTLATITVTTAVSAVTT